jgi:hypothetical protein
VSQGLLQSIRMKKEDFFSLSVISSSTSILFYTAIYNDDGRLRDNWKLLNASESIWFSGASTQTHVSLFFHETKS